MFVKVYFIWWQCLLFKLYYAKLISECVIHALFCKSEWILTRKKYIECKWIKFIGYNMSFTKSYKVSFAGNSL